MINIENKKIWIGIGVAVAVILLVWLWLAYRGEELSPESAAPISTRSEVPSGIVVPEKDSTSTPANVAVPSVVTAAAPQGETKFRSFDLRMEGGKFIPDTVAVYVGDTVHINISAVDKDYDFVQPDYGFRSVLPKGQTRVLEFQATTEGKYILYCEKCGGPENGPVGYIVVVGKQ